VFEDLLQRWDGEEAVIRYDEPSGAWMFVCVHSTARGPAGGGTRMRVYEGPADGLADAMRLSQAMTVKMAVAVDERGGGKGVLAVPELPVGDERRKLLLRYGELVASLGGTYRTAGDMNISPADLDIVKERCPWVYGTTGAGGRVVDRVRRLFAVRCRRNAERRVDPGFAVPDRRGLREQPARNSGRR
jgi:leucine dehydrogenase